MAAPQIVAFEPQASGTAGGQIVSLFGKSLDAVTAVSFGVQPALVFSAYKVSGQPTFDSRIDAVAPPGEGTAVVSVSGPGGSTNTAPTRFAWADPTPVAAVSGVTPLTGGVGTPVTIRGSGFAGAVAVEFGTAAATFEVDGDSQIRAWAPAGNTGLVDVTVIAPGGASAASIADQFTYIPLKAVKPAVLSIAPNFGAVAGGGFVIILGSGFTNATAVKFGAVPAAQFDVVSDGQIDAASPPAAGGTPQLVDVIVTTPVGNSTAVPQDGFSYVALPAVTQLTPAEAPFLGGTTVVIGGAGFSGVDEVLFGVTPAAFQFWSDSVVTATAPPGVGVVQVSVRTKLGASPPAGAASQFTYAAIPAVAQLTPASGPTAGGTSVVIAGQGFTGATTVAFGGVVAPAFTVDSDIKITAISPPGSGVVDVTVTTSGGVSPVTVADHFTYL
ncbi:MAG TPA: IPT/TIG domain-containing protein [Caulobacteraceae bacterium]